MITFMSDLLCVTNRALCRGAFLERIEALAACGPRGILLREKDLPEEDYRALAEQVLKICGSYGTGCILHGFPAAALALHADGFHAPLPVLRSMSGAEREGFRTLGASCHSVEEAREAEALGCTYLTAGHIFATDCKMGAGFSAVGLRGRCPAGVCHRRDQRREFLRGSPLRRGGSLRDERGHDLRRSGGLFEIF